MGERMTGTELLGLLTPGQVGVCKSVPDSLSTVPVDDIDCIRLELSGSLQNMRQQRTASQRLQYLRPV